MVNSFDDFVERETTYDPLGDRFRDQRLLGLPRTEWPSYLDQTAIDLLWNVQIEDFRMLDSMSFGRELGSFYKQGLSSLGGRYSDIGTLLNDRIDDSTLGDVVFQLNQLNHDIQQGVEGITDVQHATEAVVEKLLTHSPGASVDATMQLGGGSVGDLAIGIVRAARDGAAHGEVLDQVANTTGESLLEVMDRPQMVTPLWPHQREALAEWVDAGYRGYIDMATATGKTVVGLGAIAARFGTPHPDDAATLGQRDRWDGDRKARVLIVAHRELILAQWRREFDRHLDIPYERTAGGETIDLSWGRIEFQTPQRLANRESLNYDLAILDEAHHYVTGRVWGGILDELDGDVIAMSGSVDQAGERAEEINRRLSNTVGPLLKRYTIVDGRADGVIPSFEWTIQYAPFAEDNGELERVTRRVQRSFGEFKKRTGRGELETGTDRDLDTFDQVRRFSHTTEGQALKREDEGFKRLTTQLFSRRTNLWNLSPSLAAVIELVDLHLPSEKIVVLADSKAQIEQLADHYRDRLGEDCYVVSGDADREAQLNTVDTFDQADAGAVIIGTGNLLGEGVDMQTATVGINMATAGVNEALVQRIGRVLRNPGEGEKTAQFYNVVGVPTELAAAVPREDGRRAITDAGGFAALGESFRQLPTFGASGDQPILAKLISSGKTFIERVDDPGDTRATRYRDALMEAVGDVEKPAVIMDAWSAYSIGVTEEFDAIDVDATAIERSTPEAKTTTIPSRIIEARIRDLVTMQPTTVDELAREWVLDEQEVRQQLVSTLAEYHLRDDERIIASRAALAAVPEDLAEQADIGDVDAVSAHDLSLELVGLYDMDVSILTDEDLALIDPAIFEQYRPWAQGLYSEPNRIDPRIESYDRADVLGAPVPAETPLEHPHAGDLAEEGDRGAMATDETDVEDETQPDAPEPAGSEAADEFWDASVDRLTLEAATTGDAPAPSSDLDRKIDEWKAQLLDLTRRNSMISFRATKGKSLPLEGHDPIAIAEAFADSSVIHIGLTETDHAATDAFVAYTDRTRAEAHRSIESITRHQKNHLRERGVDTLYLSVGMLRWYEQPYSDEPLRSPLFLLAVDLDTSRIDDPDLLDAAVRVTDGDLIVNPALRKKLDAELDVQLPADAELDLDTMEAGFATVGDAIASFGRWELQPDMVLGIFDFLKYSLYADIEANRERIREHPIVRALVDDLDPIRDREAGVSPPRPQELDATVDPSDSYQVLDADSSQQAAIEAAKAGQSFVMQGPPGTGKSQTIANIISEKLAAGERILFVSEKQAALDVVKSRLDAEGIGRFCLEAHGRNATTRSVLSNLEGELDVESAASVDGGGKVLQQLRRTRRKLNAYGEDLFHAPDGWETTIYEALGVVARTDGVPRVEVGIVDPVTVGQEAYERARDELRVMEHFATEIDTFHTHPWGSVGAEIWEIDMGATAEASLSTMREACEGLIAAIDPVAADLEVSVDTLEDVRVLAATLQLLGERPEMSWTPIIFDPKTAGKRKGLSKLRNLDKRIGQLRDQLTSRYAPTFLEEDATELADRLAEFGALRAINREFRELRRKIHRHAVGGYTPNHAAMTEDVRDLEKLQRYERDRQQLTPVIEGLGELYQGGHSDWEAIAEARGWAGELRELPEWVAEPIQRGLLDDGLPEVPDGADLREAIQDFEAAYEELRRRFEMDALEIDGTAVESQSLGLVIERLDALRSQIPALQQRVEFNQQRRRVGETIAAGYFERFLEEEHPAEHLVASFEREFFTGWTNQLYPDTAFRDFSEEEYRRLRTDFREADVLQRQIAREGVIQQVLANRHGLRDADGDSEGALLVRREIQKQRRHTPLRELIEEAGGYITELTPCLMMSPLSVAQFLPADAVEFDVVIFDEASQVQPQDAISAIIRAEQAIIAGDSKQLPPTTFFDVDVETAEDVREDLDSILEELNVVLPQHRLRWHYRSRTNELIDFSNDRYYGNSLLTFPENDESTATGVEYVYVEDGLYDRGGSRQNMPEAEQVVALIAEHAATSPEKSLGVVAFSSAQEQAIRDVLEQRQRDDADLRKFVRQEDVLDEFFIKNLEMVQGDERDRMIFSIGYGPDRHGKITMNFGPMNHTGGERRLNVAITRAREAVTVVTSIDPDDIDTSRTEADGVEDLKRYLRYARDGPVVLQREVEVDDTLQFDSDFEEAVYDVLTDEGYDVASQVGTANYSIDLAIRDPDHPGRFLLGIECDGAAYHASKTARDRDRTRQAVLESLGWTIHRIWSPDWASNPRSEVERIDAVVEQIREGDPPAPTAMPDVEPMSTTTVPVDELEPGARLTADDAAAEMPIRFTTYVEPTVSRTDRHDPEALGIEPAAMNSLEDVVLRGGPIVREEAYRQAMRLWEYERLDDEVRQIFDGLLSKLRAADRVIVHDDALYPAGDAFTPEVRCHDGDDTRAITNVPETELMLAVVGVLVEVGDVAPDELIETTTERLGYARVGARIDRTLRATIERLQSMDVLAAEDGELSLVTSPEASVEVIVDGLR